MGESERKVTIKDVARMAEVSIGTVDRVLHNRGEVSEKSKQRILDIIKEIGYKPNIYASMLASNKHYHIFCVVPKMVEGEYWGLIRNGITRAAEDNKHHNISIHVLEFDQFDVQSFRTAATELLSSEAHGVVIAPIFREETLRLTRQLSEREIPYVYIDSKPENTGYMAYFGTPMYESGCLVAALLSGNATPQEIACIEIGHGTLLSNNSTELRREGFVSYLATHFPDTKIYSESIHPYDMGHNMELLKELLTAHPGIRHIVTFNSRIYLIAECLEQLGLEGYSLVGFDTLERNVTGLKKGYVHYLIAQHTETQLLQSINSLVSALVFNTPPSQRDSYMSMDIIIKENVDFYRDIQSVQPVVKLK